ncbi:MAG: asparagine synthetase B [Gymnodinialimonas sp.]
MLGLEKAPPLSETALFARAYERWGTDLGRHVLGAWAYIAVDPGTGSVVTGRDAIGCQGIYFTRRGDTLEVADDLVALIRDAQVAKCIDLAALAQFGVGQKRDARTLYSGVQAVQPGHAIVFRRGREPAQHKLWDPREVAEIRYRSDAEYFAAFREVYGRAVARVMTPNTPTAVALSSGLDSGTVAALAVPTLRTQGRTLRAITWTPEVTRDELIKGRLRDELDGVQALSDHFGGIDISRVRGFPVSPLTSLDAMLAACGQPDYAIAGWAWYYNILHAAKGLGIARVVTGDMGNFTVSANTMGVPERRSALTNRIINAVRDVRWARTGIPADIKLLIKPRFVEHYTDAPVDPDLARRQQEAPQPFKAIYGLMMSGMSGTNRAIAASFGMDLAVPTLDREVMDFCFGLPPEQFARKGEQRLLIRRAFSDLLPPSSLAKGPRGQPSSDLPFAIVAERDRIEERLARAKANPIAQEALDLPALQRVGRDLMARPEDQLALHRSVFLMRGLTIARFLEGVDDIAEAT